MRDTVSPHDLEAPCWWSCPVCWVLPLWFPLASHLMSPTLSDSSLRVLTSLSFGAYSTGCPFLCEAELGFILAPFPCSDFQKTVSFRTAILRTHICCHLLPPQSFGLTGPQKLCSGCPHRGSTVSMASYMLPFKPEPLWRSIHSRLYGLHIKTFMKCNFLWLTNKVMWIMVLQTSIMVSEVLVWSLLLAKWVWSPCASGQLCQELLAPIMKTASRATDGRLWSLLQHLVL